MGKHSEVSVEKADVSNVLNLLVTFTEIVLSAKTSTECNKTMNGKDVPYTRAYTLPNGVYTANDDDVAEYLLDHIVKPQLYKLTKNNFNLMESIKYIVEQVDKLQVEAIELSETVSMDA